MSAAVWINLCTRSDSHLVIPSLPVKVVINSCMQDTDLRSLGSVGWVMEGPELLPVLYCCGF